MSKFYPKTDNTIPCDVNNLRIDRSYIAHFQVAAAKAISSCSSKGDSRK